MQSFLTMCRNCRLMLLLVNLLFVQCSSGKVKTNPDAPLKLIASVALPHVHGRIDHLAYNIQRQLLYVAALGNNTVEVVDVKNRRVVHTISGLREPQGICFIPESNVIIVANGEDGSCAIFNADSYKQIKLVKLKADADNVRYDSVAKEIYVGYGSGGIAIIDANTFKQVGDIRFTGHPESFQLYHHKIFVNVPDEHLVNVIDLDKKMVVSGWRIDEASGNFPMAIDTTNGRLFFGCRHPAKLLVINAETGKAITTLDIDGDVDDVFYDRSSHLIYTSCGSGSIDIFKQLTADTYEVTSRVETLPGARTSLLIPQLNQLIIAAPARMGHDAQLMIYEKR